MIVDVMMPGMTGTDVAAAIQRRRADIPVVLVTGTALDVETETARDLRARGIRAVLAKPFEVSRLADLMASLWAG